MQQARDPWLPSGKGFLDLPLELRERIYQEAGLIVEWRLVIGYDEPDGCHALRPRTLAYNLFQTCQRIYTEVREIILSRNEVIIPQTNIENGLRYLLRLPPQVCSSMIDLTVHLQLQRPASFRGLAVLDTPLDQPLIDLWKSAAAHILTNAKPGALKMFLICDTGDGDRTASVPQPFFDFPGTLKDLQLRLYHEKRWRLYTVAEKAARSPKLGVCLT